MGMKLTVGYAYATSAHAAECGASRTGCWIVLRHHNLKTGAPLRAPVLAVEKAFATEAEAERWAKSWNLGGHPDDYDDNGNFIGQMLNENGWTP